VAGKLNTPAWIRGLIAVGVVLGLFAVAAGSPVLGQSSTSTQAGKPASTSVGAPAGQAPAGPGPGRGPGGRQDFAGPPTRDEHGADFVPWWKDPAIVKEINLTVEQAAQIDRIYEQRAKQIAPYLEEYDKQRAELDRLFRERTADARAIELQAAKLMTPRLEIDKTRFVMLYRMFKVLSTDQNNKLQDIWHRTGNRGRGGNPAR
jgi:Spy/CpxP family protein refolding chaperone